MKKKTFVIDTNVLLSDPNAVTSFDEHDVIIPMAVLEELDRHKSRPDEVGRNARQVSRSLDDMRQKGSLFDGVQIPNGGIVRVASIDSSVMAKLPIELQAAKVDNLLIAFMLQLQPDSTKVDAEREYILVSKDINVRLKCDALGITCDDYLKMRVASDPQKFYRGVEVVEIEEELVDQFYTEGLLQLPKETLDRVKLYPNQIVVIKNIKDGQTTKSAITKCVMPDKPLQPIAKIEQAFGLKPRNKEQSFSLDLLFDDNVKLLTLVGPSGCVSPDTLVDVKLSHIHWHMPVPDDTYNHAPSENEQEDSDL